MKDIETTIIHSEQKISEKAIRLSDESVDFLAKIFMPAVVDKLTPTLYRKTSYKKSIVK